MTEPIVVPDRTFKPGDRVVVCSPAEMGNAAPAWGTTSSEVAGMAGTVVGWDSAWMVWRVDMDDDTEEARWASAYLKPEITTIEDVDKYLAS